MTENQLLVMVAWYSSLCQGDYADAWETIESIDAYSEEEKARAAAEVAYYHRHGYLPTWKVMISRVDVVDGSYIFIHGDEQVM